MCLRRARYRVLLPACSRRLPVKMSNICCKSRLICSCGMMPTCNHVRKCAALQAKNVVNFNFPNMFFEFFLVLVTTFRILSTPVDNQFVMSSSTGCNRSPDACALGLWTRCVQMTTQHGVLLSVASNNNLPSLTLLVL